MNCVGRCVHDCVTHRVHFSWAAARNESKLDLELRTDTFTQEDIMYISSQGLQAIHQEMVNDNLRRSDQRRMLREWRERQQETGAPTARAARRLIVTMLTKATRALTVLSYRVINPVS